MNNTQIPDEITQALKDYVSTHTTFSSSAATRLAKQLLELGVTTIVGLEYMSADQLDRVSGKAQRQLLYAYLTRYSVPATEDQVEVQPKQKKTKKSATAKSSTKRKTAQKTKAVKTEKITVTSKRQNGLAS